MWAKDLEEARQLQMKWRGAVVAEGEPMGVRHVCGVDISHDRNSTRGFAAAVVMRAHNLEVVETVFHEGELWFPYIPGYLSFREGPLIMELLSTLKTGPDLFVFDGQGLAHPYRFGLACHMGVLLGKPSLGVAKKIFVGTHTKLGSRAGNRANLVDAGEVVGQALRTRAGASPVYVSPGHLISVPAATEWAFRLSRGLRIPEPTRLAHVMVNEKRRGTA
ncbi:MAG: endonuclease V [Planctomycetota bacterium]